MKVNTIGRTKRERSRCQFLRKPVINQSDRQWSDCGTRNLLDKTSIVWTRVLENELELSKTLIEFLIGSEFLIVDTGFVL